MKTYKQKIAALRIIMKQKKFGGFILPVGDEFLSEYPHPSSQRVNWLCGFDGSAGTLAILDKKAALITDGRYIIQAEKQLAGLGIAVVNSAEKNLHRWLLDNMPPRSQLAIDLRLISVRQYAAMSSIMEDAGIGVVSLKNNPVDEIWADKPDTPTGAVFEHPLTVAGKSIEEKLIAVIAAIKSEKAEGLLVTACDSIAWVLNIRGSDLPTVPVVLSTLLIEKTGRMIWAVDAGRLDNAVKMQLAGIVEFSSPDKFTATIAKRMRGKTLLLDAMLTPANYADELEESGVIIDAGDDPIQKLKAIKNKSELKHIRKFHIEDGAALCSFLHWLDKKSDTDEVAVAEKLLSFRAMNKKFRGVSFDTIAGFNANGAIVHYRATEESCKKIKKDGILLLDSGGQYPGATTDVTRTIAIGKPTAEQKECFTLVLKGHIALASTVFPKGTTGSQLDAIARHALWQNGLDYDHGTGHGVGAYLSVHEGPQRVGKAASNVALEAGMIISNEPGYYKTGKFGIRIENLVEVVEKGQIGKDRREFLGFETITMAPVDLRLIDIKLLNKQEISWLNAYHASVYKNISPSVSGAALNWLKKATRKI